MNNKLLIVAWDGLDEKLLTRYGNNYFFENHRTGGRIDNDTNIHTRSTSELFTTFITGKHHTHHGVQGLNKYNTRGKILEKLMPKHKRYFDPVMAKIYNWLMHHTKADYRKYDKQDYQEDTMFEEVEHSEAMYVPGYNPGHAWAADLKAHTLEELSYREKPVEEAEKTIEMTFDKRREKLMERINPEKPDYIKPDLLMIQFHYVDSMQHLHGEPTLGVDHDKLEKIYNRVENISEEIEERAEQSEYKVMFMSDHGLPQNHHHNKKAFWSMNMETAAHMKFQTMKPIMISDFKKEIVDYVS